MGDKRSCIRRNVGRRVNVLLGLAMAMLAVEARAQLGCGEFVSFESGVPADWTSLDFDGTGVIWVTTSDPACLLPSGTGGDGAAACIDALSLIHI